MEHRGSFVYDNAYEIQGCARECNNTQRILKGKKEEKTLPLRIQAIVEYK